MVIIKSHKISFSNAFKSFLKSKQRGVEYLALIFCAFLNFILIYEIIKSPRLILTAIAIAIMGLLFSRIVIDRDLKNIKENKDPIKDAKFYAFFYLLLSTTLSVIFTNDILLGIFIPALVLFDLHALRDYSHFRLEKKTDEWLRQINAKATLKKEDLKDKIGAEFYKLKSVEHFKNDREADMFIVFGQKLEKLDCGIERFFISKEKRIAYKAARLLKDLEAHNLDVFYSFQKVKGEIRTTDTDTLILCEGINKGDVEAIKADF